MIIPRRDNYFNRCKSNIKFLEAAMCEIPVIAQSFDDGPYEEITPDMGVLIRDNSKWLDEINRLIEDKDLRRSMGRKAREYVLKNYNIADHYQEWNNAYKSLYENN
jgi:glycosyltransferase involved in cell wall biosynthesis